MDRIQRNGLIALFVLLLVALGGRFLGTKSADGIPVTQEVIALDPSALPEVNLLPPQQRRFFVGAEDFNSPPLRSPLEEAPFKPAVASAKITSPKPVDAALPLPSTRVVRVREGETLSDIAARELGSAMLWEDLARFNSIGDPGALKIGQPLKIPPKRSDSGEESDIKDLRVWVVEAGQTPGEIARKVYGDVRLWRKLLSANGIEDPRSLREGTKLQIPPLREED